MFFAIVRHQQRQLIGQYLKSLLLRKHSDRDQIGKQAQVDTQFARIWHLTQHFVHTTLWAVYRNTTFQWYGMV